MIEFKLQKKKNDKNILRIIKPNTMHIFRPWQTPAKFQNDSAKIVGGVASTRLDSFSTDRQMDAQGSRVSLPTLAVGM